MLTILVSVPVWASYSDREETVVTAKGSKSDKEGYYEITFTALSHCHALNLVRVYDKDGVRIFPDDEALGARLTEENTEYKREFSVKGDPFPITIDLKEWGKSHLDDKKCDNLESWEKPDYHRHGPFLEDGTAAAYHGLKAGRTKDPQEKIDTDREFEKGPGKYRK